MPHDLLFRGKPAHVPLSSVHLPDALVAPFAHQLSALLTMARQPSDLHGFGLWQDTLQASLAEFVGASLGIAQQPETSAQQPEPRANDRLESLDAFIQARLDRPIRHTDLETAIGLGRTQLNQRVQLGFGCSPMMLVRKRRLKALRQSLESTPHQDLTQLSMRYGFDHQGRFSQYYRAQFGEAPSDTRRRLHGLHQTGRNG